jgi:hypothetical protein
MVKVDSHHLKLYSEYWTALFWDGESRVWVGRKTAGSVGRCRDEKQISPLRCAPVEMTVFLLLGCAGGCDGL